MNRKRRKPDPEYYVVQIEDWHWGNSFGIYDAGRGQGNAYHEFRHLEIRGSLLRPKKLQVQTAEVIFLPEPELTASERQKRQPLGVDSVSLHRGKFQALLGMPVDALDPVLSALIASRLKYVVMDGQRMRYRHGMIRHYRIDRDLGEDDLPEDDGC